jgi:hypothetical protein
MWSVSLRRSQVRVLSVIGAFALAALSLSTASADATPASSYQLSLSAGPSPIIPSSPVMLTGSLSNTSATQAAGVAPTMQGVRLLLFHRVNPERTFTEVQSSETQAGGSFQINPAALEGPLTTDRHWYLEAVSPTGQILARSGFTRTQVYATLTVNPMATGIKTGQQTSFTGIISPAHVGERVALQRLVGNRWKHIAGGHDIAAGGVFAVDHTFGLPSISTPTMLRVCFPGDDLNIRTCSAPFATTIQRSRHMLAHPRARPLPRHTRQRLLKQQARRQRQEEHQKQIHERKQKREEERLTRAREHEEERQQKQEEAHQRREEKHHQ